MTKTVLNKILIKRFRALENVEIEFGDHVTVICGKNGTSKSSILGIAAQIFSFDKDYKKGETLSFRTIAGAHFKSLPKEHFRFSNQFDVPGSLDVEVALKDGYTGKDATGELELSRRGEIARPVVRKNSIAEGKNKSRNFTHPVVFLGLERLMPIAGRTYTVANYKYLTNNNRRFIDLSNELLNKNLTAATGTGGSINSAVVHGANYDQDSVSAGEDNVGQIVLALMSFEKLKSEYPDYKGGLLLIDEADAGLFPAAQEKLIDILGREARRLNLQVVMTSHSPTLIEHVYNLGRRERLRYKTVYLTDTYGKVKAMPDMNWDDIRADLLTRTVNYEDDVVLPKINVYFEDREGYELFKAVMAYQKVNRLLNHLPDISLGCSNYVQLAKNRVPEFAHKSLIVLDADAQNTDAYQTIVLLPGGLPPDQLLFEYLHNLPADNELWRNPIRFTKATFNAAARQVINYLQIGDDPIDLREKLVAAGGRGEHNGRKPRELFKAFYKHPDTRRFLDIKGRQNPWKLWIGQNQEACEKFRSVVVDRVSKIFRNGYKVESNIS